MGRKVRTHIRSNVVGYVALFVALSLGTAWAASLPKNSVGPKQIKANAVRSAETANDALTGTDINEGTLGQVPSAQSATTAQAATAAETASSAETANLLDGLNSTDFLRSNGKAVDASHADNADTVGGIPPSELGTLVRSDDNGGCEDDGQDGEVCASVNLNLPRAGRVLLIASGAAAAGALDDTSGVGSTTDDTSVAHGHCVVTADGGPGANVAAVQLDNLVENEQFALTTDTGSMSQGIHNYGVRCTQGDGRILWGQLNISAVMLGNG